MTDIEGVISEAERKAMTRLQDLILQHIVKTGMPPAVAINALASVLGHCVTYAVYRGPEDEAAFLAFKAEAVRRIFDAAFSMEDFRDRRAPWRVQSSSLKASEREGGGLVRITKGGTVN